MEELRPEQIQALAQTEMLRAFLEESNRIEGEGPPSGGEMATTSSFLALPEITVKELEALALVYAGSRAKLRSLPGMNVRVGGHRPPPGGPEVVVELERLLAGAPAADPWGFHVAYEELHPFMDGNGRTGRVIWAWQMLKMGEDPFGMPFLQRAYYQALEHAKQLIR